MSERKKPTETADNLLSRLVNLLTLLTMNWGIVLSAALALGAGFSKTLYSFVRDPHVILGGVVFLWALWSYIGLSVLQRLKFGIKTIPINEYAHAILIESLSFAHDKDSEDAFLQIGINLRSVCSGPMQIEVHDFRIVIDGRTIPDSPVISMTVPRFGQKGIISGSFKRDAIKSGGAGSIDLILHYGPPGGPMVRKYRMKTNILVKLGEIVGLGNHIVSEEDVPL